MVAGILAIVLIIFVRFLRVQREQEHASSELALPQRARVDDSQEKLATLALKWTRLQPGQRGGRRLLPRATAPGGGCCSHRRCRRKGLQAAMNVSCSWVRLRRTPEHSPAKILQSLNRVLVGSDSFTLASHLVWPDGALVLSSAGHLRLISIARRPPAGTLPSASSLIRPMKRSALSAPRRPLLLMSDGVVEAPSPPANSLASTRLQPEQPVRLLHRRRRQRIRSENDITVLTVRRLAPVIAA